MGNQKIKWTGDEEDALLAGKWKNILRDPEFSDQLINRSNIDLKDKWRHLSVAPGTQCSKDKGRPLKVKEEGVPLATVASTPPSNANSSSSSSSSPATSLPRSASSEFSVDNFEVDTKNPPRYDGTIFDALSALADANGSDVGSIVSFIEPRHTLPPNFRKVLSSRLRRLAAQGKLSKLLNFYKLPDTSETTTRPTPAPKLKETNIKPRQTNNPTLSEEMIDEAAITAACKVVEAEN